MVAGSTDMDIHNFRKILFPVSSVPGGDVSAGHPSSLSTLTGLDASRLPLSKPSLHRNSPDNADLLYSLAGEPLEKLDLSQADFAPSKTEFKSEYISEFKPLSSAPPAELLPPTLPLDLSVPLQLQQNGHAEPQGGSQRSTPDSPAGSHQRLVEATIESPAHLLSEPYGNVLESSQVEDVSAQATTLVVTSPTHHDSQQQGVVSLLPEPQDSPPCLLPAPTPSSLDAYPATGTSLSMLPMVSNSDSLPISPCSTLSDGGPESQSDSGVSVSTSDQSEAPGLPAAGMTESPSMAAPATVCVEAGGQADQSAATMASISYPEPASLPVLPEVGSEATGTVPTSLPALAMDSSACDAPPPQSQASPAAHLQPSAEPIAMDTTTTVAGDGTSPDSDTAMEVSCQSDPVGFGEDEESLSETEMAAYLADMSETNTASPAENTLSGSLQTSAGQIEAARPDPTTVVLEDNVICLESCPGPAEVTTEAPMEVSVTAAAQHPVEVHPEPLPAEVQTQVPGLATEIIQDLVPCSEQSVVEPAPLVAAVSENTPPVFPASLGEPLTPSRPGGLLLASPLSPSSMSSVMSSPSTPGERRGSSSSNTSVERFLAPALGIPGIATPMEDAGFAKVPGYIPSGELGEVEEEEEPVEDVQTEPQTDLLTDTRTSLPVVAEATSPSMTEAPRITDALPAAAASDHVDSASSEALTAPSQSPAHSGARPKDPAVLRRNRPTSLLGLSKPEMPTGVPMSGQDSPEGEYLVPPNHLTPMSVPPAPSVPSPHHPPPGSLPLPQMEDSLTAIQDPAEAGPADSTDHASLPEIPGLTSPTRLPSAASEAGTPTADGPGKQKRPTSLNLSLPADPRVDSTAGSTPYMLSSDDSTPLGECR